MHLCISELHVGSPSLTSIATCTLCSCNSTMLRYKEWATVRDTQIHRQGVVTPTLPIEPSATGVKILDPLKSALTA